MPLGARTHIGIAKETTFGTPVAATDYLRFASESINEEIEQIISEQLNGTVDEGASYEGAHTISGDVSADVYPNAIGHLLRSAFGVPTTTQPDVTNNPTVYEHVFTPVQDNFSAQCALPPYTYEIHRDLEQAFQYSGVVVNDLSMTFGTDTKIMQVTAAIVAKALALISKTTPNFETTDPFLWNQATITIDGNENKDLQTLEVAINNSAEGAATLNGERTISLIRRTGRRAFPVSFTFDLKDMAEYNRFKSQSEVPAIIELTGATISGSYNYKLKIEMPKLRYTAFPINVGGPDAITAQVTGSAKYSASDLYAMRITLTNTTTSY